MASTFVTQCGQALYIQKKNIPQAIQIGKTIDWEPLSEKKLVVFTGCGDSYAVAEYGKWTLLQEGINAIAVSAPEVNQLYLNNEYVVIGITASGRSIATINAIKHSKKCGAETIALTDNKESRICKIADTAWITQTKVETYDIIPTATTSAAMALLFGLIINKDRKRYSHDVDILQNDFSSIFKEAEGEGRLISELIDPKHKIYFISEGPNAVAAKIGMMKINETSLAQGIAILREEFQHYGSLPTQKNDLAVLVTDSPASERDQLFTRILWEQLGLKAYHLHTPDNRHFETPIAQTIVNTLVLQIAVYNVLQQYDPNKKWFRLPHAKAFKIY